MLKSIPITGVYVCEILRISQYLDNQLIYGEDFVSLTHQPRFTQQKHFLFLSLVLIYIRD
jgi:hypothetical protein